MEFITDRKVIDNLKTTGAPFMYEFADVDFSLMTGASYEVGLVDKRMVGESLLTFVNGTDVAVDVVFEGNDGENDFELTGSPLALTAAGGATPADYALVTEPWPFIKVTLEYAGNPTSGTVLIRHCNGAGKFDV